jgi:hypothetical protein
MKDPLAVFSADWMAARFDMQDDLRYDALGALSGWTRTRGGASSEFTAEGARILARNAEERPTRTETPAYPLRRAPRGALEVEERSPAAAPGTEPPPA